MDIKYSYKFYKNFKKFVLFYMKHIYDIECNGIENIPKDKNYVLSGNHLNILDSWLLIAITDEHLRFMVDKKLYDTKAGEWFFKKVGTFDIDPNETDPNKKMMAVRNSVELLKSGEIVSIFPEGKTHPVNVHVPFKGGVPAISKLGNTVLVPFGIEGSYKPFTKLKVNIGEPINFKELRLPKEEENIYLEKKVRELEPYDGEIHYLQEKIIKVIENNEEIEKNITEEIIFNNKKEEFNYLDDQVKKLKQLKKK